MAGQMFLVSLQNQEQEKRKEEEGVRERGRNGGREERRNTDDSGNRSVFKIPIII